MASSQARTSGCRSTSCWKAWAYERSQLWNRAEAAERRADAQVAREIVVALPKELNEAQQWELVRGYVREEFVAKGMVAHVAIHRNAGNPHAHILLSMREMGAEGFAANKNREWNKPESLERWRERWAEESNRALERSGVGSAVQLSGRAGNGSERRLGGARSCASFSRISSAPVTLAGGDD